MGDNPTFYRSPTDYFALLQQQIGASSDATRHLSVFHLERAVSVNAYVQVATLYLVIFTGFSWIPS